MLLTIDRGARPAEPSDGGTPPRGLCGRLAAAYRTLLDRIWRADEEWAAEQGLIAERSRWGLSIRVTRSHALPGEDGERG